MADKDLNIQLLINEYTENYVEKIFYFCLKKTGSVYDAQDLSSDITVNILQSLNKGIIPIQMCIRDRSYTGMRSVPDV